MRDDPIRDALTACKAWLEENVEMHGYGFFPGGDPRSFTPGEVGDDCTEEEHAAWRAACARANAADTAPEQRAQDESPACKHGPGLVATEGKYGLGAYSVRHPELDELLTKVNAALAVLP